MFTIENSLVGGSDLPNKGRILLSNGPSFVIREYAQPIFLFKNPEKTNSSSLDFMPNDILRRSFEVLVRNHYAPLTGCIEIINNEIYLVWDNVKDGVYSPRFPINFESTAISTDYNTFYQMVQNSDPSLRHSKAPDFFGSKGENEPLLFIKITRLKPGNQAVAISYSCSHMVMDACSVTTIFANWAALFCQILKDPSPQSSLDYTRYTIPHPPLFGSPDYSKFRAPESKLNTEEKDDDNKSNNSLEFLPSPEEIDEYCLIIPENKQNEIREEAHKLGVTFSVYLFALFWKEQVILQVRHDPELIGDTSSFCIPVDIRQKLGIPTCFCSSAMITYFIKSKVEDIMRMRVDDIAQMIKKKTDSELTPEGICSYVDKYISLWKNACQKGGSVYGNFKRNYIEYLAGTPKILATSLLNFKITEIDFNSSRLVCTRTPKRPVSGSIIMTSPNSNVTGNGIQVYVTLPKGCDISGSSVFNKFIIA